MTWKKSSGNSLPNKTKNAPGPTGAFSYFRLVLLRQKYRHGPAVVDAPACGSVDGELLEVVQFGLCRGFSKQRENHGAYGLDVFADELGDSDGHAGGLFGEVEIFANSAVFRIRGIELERNRGSENDLFHVAENRG
jgi:hypothetical protein